MFSRLIHNTYNTCICIMYVFLQPVNALLIFMMLLWMKQDATRAEHWAEWITVGLQKHNFITSFPDLRETYIVRHPFSLKF